MARLRSKHTRNNYVHTALYNSLVQVSNNSGGEEEAKGAGLFFEDMTSRP